MLYKVCDGLGSSAPINYFLWTALDPEDINDFYLTANELSEMPETLKIKKVKLYVLWSRPQTGRRRPRRAGTMVIDTANGKN